MRYIRLQYTNHRSYYFIDYTFQKWQSFYVFFEMFLEHHCLLRALFKPLPKQNKLLMATNY